MLKTTALTLGYVDRRGTVGTTIRHLDLRIRAGELLCLLGPSGCGKTTLLKALGGFLSPMHGSVLYEGRELATPTPEIVMIFQENNLYPWLTVEKNIAFGPRMHGVAADRIRELTDELLTTVGLAEARHQFPHELSGGMRQRVAIALALAANSRVLRLDEPFSALDVSLRRRMQEFLRSVWKSSAATLVMVTHSIEEALLVSERVLVLGVDRDGIVEAYETRIGPHNGARVVARAWVDPAFKSRLLRDGTAAMAELGVGGFSAEHMVVVENLPDLHNVIVCTLCSCYPWGVLGLPPVWYKSFAYRSRLVRDPRGVLCELGLVIPDTTEVRVWDSTSDIRYLVLPERPPGTGELDETALASLVTRDAMIGTAIVQARNRP